MTSLLVAGVIAGCSTSSDDPSGDPAPSDASGTSSNRDGGSRTGDNDGAPGTGNPHTDGGSPSSNSDSGSAGNGPHADAGTSPPPDAAVPSNCPTLPLDWNAYCNVITPSVQVAPGATTAPIYGQVYSANLTGDPSLAGCIAAQLGVGPVNSEPAASTDWTWTDASFVTLTGIDDHNDEYAATLTAPIVSTTTSYSYAYRFQARAGQGGWSYCDTSNASPAGFSSASDGLLVVTSSPTSSPATWRQVSVSGTQTCGTRSDGSLWCWGAQGNGTQLTPARVGSDFAWTKVTAYGDQACGVRQDGSLWCWASADAASPTQMFTNDTWTDVGLGTGFGCALASDQTMWCWGKNDHGQLGDGTTTTRAQPVLAGPANLNLQWRSFVVGDTSVCGHVIDGATYCWGDDSRGQIGAALHEGSDQPPTLVENLPPYSEMVSLFGGYTSSCGIGQKVQGVTPSPLYCWGSVGQQAPGLFLGWTPQKQTPPETGHEWGSVASGPTHLCAIMDDHQMYCAGDNLNGELGAGPALTGQGFEPVGGGWASVAVGYADTCGIQLDGSLWCWGQNAFGQVGDGTTQQASAPVRISP